MNILITGASGLLGNHLTRLFLSRGHQVRELIEHENADDGLETLPVEIRLYPGILGDRPRNLCPGMNPLSF
jgi:nucleoside-diphosphate-sugar epimerase